MKNYLFFKYLGIVVLIIGLLLTYNTYSQSKYTEVYGKVLESEIKRKQFSGNGNKLYWYAYVKYEYYFNGLQYINDTLSTDKLYSDSKKEPSEEIRNILNKYKKDSNIIVYVSLNNPKKSVLIKQGYNVLWIVFIGISILFISQKIKNK